MRDCFFKNQPTHFIFPIDGDCLNCRDGIVDGDSLIFSAKIKSQKGSRIYVNGVMAKEEKDGIYTAELRISDTKNRITAENQTDGSSATVTVFKLPEKAVGGFRISSDDNILFLYDLTFGSYSSIFEHPYLAVYKKAHDLYGAKVHLNLFYELDSEAMTRFTSKRPYFNLSMMTDRYKEEFKRNSDWLKLAFHARSEFPAKPYMNATAEKITEDFNLVCQEIKRFAGEECIPSTTTTHFGSGNLECVRALRGLGLHSLTGYFTLDPEGMPRVAYYADTELVNHVWQRDFFADTEVDIVFGRIDSVLNCGTLDEVIAEVTDAADDPHRGGFVSIMIHEQYFYKDYRNYLPDFEERVLLPARLLYERGYRGTHISEIINF